MLAAVGCGGPKPAPAVPAAVSLFSDGERQAIVSYWSAPGRYTVSPSPELSLTWQGRVWVETTRRRLPERERRRFDSWLKARQTWDQSPPLLDRQMPRPAIPPSPPAGIVLPSEALFAPERVNITVAGSIWHWNYARLPEDRRVAAEQTLWETWILSRIAADKSRAGGGPAAPPPGPMPAALREALGEPPPLFERVRPTRYTVTFAPDDAPAPFVYTDTIPFPDRYAYYRSANGIVRYGRPLRDYTGEEKVRLDSLFAAAGRDRSEQNVLRAVSRLEGGFEAVNTYDTGYVSIGFIQFITARDGNGSLAAVLQWHKQNDPEDFQATFRRFGVDVAPEGVIVVVDPAAGAELRGAEAVKKIIDDKRLAAVFERAGGHDGFRLAQIRVARDRYWPGDDSLVVPLTTVYEQRTPAEAPKKLGLYWGAPDAATQALAAQQRQFERQKTEPDYRSWAETQPLTAKVSDLIRSEAGMATLMDRKVHRGNIRGISEVAAQLMRQNKLTKIETLRFYERPLIIAMKHRADFLSDPTLTQPK